MKRLSSSPAQLGFDDLLADADKANERAAFEKLYGHLPITMEEADPFFHDLIGRHHAAMLAADSEQIFRLRDIAENLALRLNKGDPGILADENAPGCMLARLTLAEEGVVPLWGQGGSCVIELRQMRIGIKMDGLFGLGAPHSPWMDFTANAIDWEKPFLSETGYRSFLGIHAELVPGITPDRFAAEVIEAHVCKNMKGKLVSVKKKLR